MPARASDEWLDRVQAAANADPAFRRFAAQCDATVGFVFEDEECAFTVDEGEVTAAHPAPKFVDADVTLRAPSETWDKYLSESPPPFFNDLRPVWLTQDLAVEGDVRKAMAHWRTLKQLVAAIREAEA